MKMPLGEQVRLLSMVDFFEPLSSEELEEIGRRAPDIFLEEKDFVAPWDAGERIFVLKRGRVQVYEVTPEGEEVTLSVVEGGNMFGQMALTGQQLSGVYVRAMVPSVICSLTRRDLEQIILNHPEVGLRLVRHLSRQLREREMQMAELVYKGVPARLASLIVRLIASEGVMTKEGAMVPTRYTHEQLGTMIGAKRVAVTRAFNLLRQEGAVELRERHIYIRDMESIKRIADARG
jgi:CRP/FNR family transcriptional regulator, cyclic AMP receptor protein